MFQTESIILISNDKMSMPTTVDTSIYCKYQDKKISSVLTVRISSTIALVISTEPHSGLNEKSTKCDRVQALFILSGYFACIHILTLLQLVSDAISSHFRHINSCGKSSMTMNKSASPNSVSTHSLVVKLVLRT
jgi:hypothetical protein